MALMKAKEVPRDAIILDEVQATEYAWNIVTEWDSLSDTWALKYGPAFLGGVNALSGVLINSHYRNKLKLGKYGYFASMVPITVMPAMLTALFHRHLITTNLLLMKNEACPMCYEVRSAALQWGLGFAYPMVLGPTSAMMLAHRYATCRTPDLLEGPKVVFQFLRKITRPFTGTLTLIFIGQFIASSFCTYYEMRNNFSLRAKIMEIEAKLEAKQGMKS